jgi:uncharacterized membrane protein
MLDVDRVLSRVGEQKIFDGDQLGFASRMQMAVANPCVILHAPEYNSPVYLVGARSLMGYQGHIWTRGMSEGTRPDDIRRIYQGAPDAERLLREYHVDYIAVTTEEIDTYKPINDKFLKRYPRIIDWHGLSLYDVSGR